MIAALLAACAAGVDCGDGFVEVIPGYCDRLDADGDSGPQDPPDTGEATTSGFVGIETASWDRADGISATWTAAVGDPLRYTLTVLSPDGEVVATTESDGSEARITGLDDGDYDLYVVGTGPDGESLGGRAMRQLVGENRVMYRGEVAISGGARTLSGEGDVAVAGGGTSEGGSVTLVEISDAEAPRVLAELLDMGEITDVGLDRGLLAVAVDTALHPDVTESVRLFDASDPAAPREVGAISADDDWAHTLTFGGGNLFLASTKNAWVAVYDVTDPAEPVRVSAVTPPPPAGVHDQTWADGMLYVAYTSGLEIADLSDPANPELVGVYEAGWPGAFIHNAWPTDDGASLAVSEEVVGGPMYVFDIANPGALTLLSTTRVDDDDSVHNIVVRDRYAFCAWYVDGLLVYDLADPASPLLVGSYDSWSGSEEVETRSDGTQWPNVNGATHVWPFGPHIAVSDSARGVIVVDFFPVERSWGDGWYPDEGA